MKENEAIKIFKERLELIKTHYAGEVKDYEEALETGIQALETIKKLYDRNMTTEVLENYMQFEDECVKKGFTFKSVIEAREKQKAKKPDFTEDKEFALCPCCNGKGLSNNQKYCDNCGQKIDWSDEE